MANIADIRAVVAHAIDGLNEAQQMTTLVLGLVQDIRDRVEPLGAESANQVLHNAIETFNAVENHLGDSIGFAEDIRIGLNNYLRAIGAPPVE